MDSRAGGWRPRASAFVAIAITLPVAACTGTWFTHRRHQEGRRRWLCRNRFRSRRACHLIDVFAAVGKSPGTGIVTEPVAAHSVPR